MTTTTQRNRILTTLAILLLALSTGCQTAPPPIAIYPPEAGEEMKSRSGPDGSKLSPELEALYTQFARKQSGQPGGAQPGNFSDAQLTELFGIEQPGAQSSSVNVSIQLAKPINDEALRAMGVQVAVREGLLCVGAVPIDRLRRIGLDPSVQSVEQAAPLEQPVLPKPPAAVPMPDLGPGRSLSGFDKQGLTGKGVIIAVIDSGIDFRHDDFRKPDGSSRILYLYDMLDSSFATSKGKKGSEPPTKLFGRPVGTLYTQAQLNAALKDSKLAPPNDVNGHGTLVAGTAAGNGRASGNGVKGTKYAGVAPEADLIVVKAASATGGFSAFRNSTAIRFIINKARTLKRPVVINMSLGGHASGHDGQETQEQLIDLYSGKGKKGVVFCVSAGNEATYPIHASGRFGPRRTGQLDVDARPIELFAKEKTTLDTYFTATDDWGLGISGYEAPFATSKAPARQVFIYKKGKATFTSCSKNMTLAEKQSLLKGKHFISLLPKNTQRVRVILPKGRYMVWGFGATGAVLSGKFAMYLPNKMAASFGQGAVQQMKVGSPGNAANAITVGSYDFRGRWQNASKLWTGYNLRLGGLSIYSNPGFRRDGKVKPDIVAPGQYTIAAFAPGSRLANPKFIVDTGKHQAWNGTSASTPYAAGVVALMLQKNPDLDAEQVRQILTSTAIKDSFTGAVPNEKWGHGKLNPAVAIKRTPKK